MRVLRIQSPWWWLSVAVIACGLVLAAARWPPPVDPLIQGLIVGTVGLAPWVGAWYERWCGGSGVAGGFVVATLIFLVMGILPFVHYRAAGGPVDLSLLTGLIVGPLVGALYGLCAGLFVRLLGRLLGWPASPEGKSSGKAADRSPDHEW